jgi:hypothetical protein
MARCPEEIGTYCRSALPEKHRRARDRSVEGSELSHITVERYPHRTSRPNAALNHGGTSAERHDRAVAEVRPDDEIAELDAAPFRSLTPLRPRSLAVSRLS